MCQHKNVVPKYAKIYKYILITLDGVIKIILIVLTSVTDQNE
jgi:hypothetical protein